MFNIHQCDAWLHSFLATLPQQAAEIRNPILCVHSFTPVTIYWQHTHTGSHGDEEVKKEGMHTPKPLEKYQCDWIWSNKLHKCDQDQRTHHASKSFRLIEVQVHIRAGLRVMWSLKAGVAGMWKKRESKCFASFTTWAGIFVVGIRIPLPRFFTPTSTWSQPQLIRTYFPPLSWYFKQQQRCSRKSWGVALYSACIKHILHQTSNSSNEVSSAAVRHSLMWGGVMIQRVWWGAHHLLWYVPQQHKVKWKLTAYTSLFCLFIYY